MSFPPSKGDPSPHRLFTLKICRCQSQGGGTEGLIWEDSEGKNIFATLRSPQCPQGSCSLDSGHPKGNFHFCTVMQVEGGKCDPKEGTLSFIRHLIEYSLPQHSTETSSTS